MEKFISSESKNSLLKIGLYQIICGFIGPVYVLWTLLATETISGPGVILLLFIMLLYIFSIITGYRCVKMKENCLNLSLANQTIQILGVSISGFAFHYSAGPFITIGVDMTTSFRWTFDFGMTRLSIYLFNDTSNFLITINLVALFVLLLVGRLQNNIKTEMEVRNDNRFL